MVYTSAEAVPVPVLPVVPVPVPVVPVPVPVAVVPVAVPVPVVPVVPVPEVPVPAVPVPEVPVPEPVAPVVVPVPSVPASVSVVLVVLTAVSEPVLEPDPQALSASTATRTAPAIQPLGCLNICLNIVIVYLVSLWLQRGDTTLCIKSENEQFDGLTYIQNKKRMLACAFANVYPKSTVFLVKPSDLATLLPSRTALKSS